MVPETEKFSCLTHLSKKKLRHLTKANRNIRYISQRTKESLWAIFLLPYAVYLFVTQSSKDLESKVSVSMIMYLYCIYIKV